MHLGSSLRQPGSLFKIKNKTQFMRKMLFLAAICFSITAFAQKKEKVDTATKQAVKQDPPQQPAFFLVGQLDDFKLLYAAVTSPDDVTQNQKKAIATWLMKIQAVPADTTKQKPK
jgi:hypothetical protein